MENQVKEVWKAIKIFALNNPSSVSLYTQLVAQFQLNWLFLADLGTFILKSMQKWIYSISLWNKQGFSDGKLFLEFIHLVFCFVLILVVVAMSNKTHSLLMMSLTKYPKPNLCTPTSNLKLFPISLFLWMTSIFISQDLKENKQLLVNLFNLEFLLPDQVKLFFRITVLAFQTYTNIWMYEETVVNYSTVYWKDHSFPTSL